METKVLGGCEIREDRGGYDVRPIARLPKPRPAKAPKLRLEPIPVLLRRRAKKKVKFLSELQQQSRLIEWINKTAAMQTDVQRAEALTWIHSIANGHARMNPVARMNAMREGMRAGVLDLFCPLPAYGKHGLYIEMKRRGGETSPDQERFIAYLKRIGYEHAVCYSWVKAAHYVRTWYGLDGSAFEPIPDEDEDGEAIRLKLEANEAIKAIKARNAQAVKDHKKALREHMQDLKRSEKLAGKTIASSKGGAKHG